MPSVCSFVACWPLCSRIHRAEGVTSRARACTTINATTGRTRARPAAPPPLARPAKRLRRLAAGEPQRLGGGRGRVAPDIKSGPASAQPPQPLKGSPPEPSWPRRARPAAPAQHTAWDAVPAQRARPNRRRIKGSRSHAKVAKAKERGPLEKAAGPGLVTYKNTYALMKQRGAAKSSATRDTGQKGTRARHAKE